ncbi:MULTISPECIES: Mrp/NBP35 family ATP-binding protein [unclassified Pseudodesulfovibrio]|uniref:Mrp/NBP35 family ATP-binding protein n=1 Tax=unclassified Pseudodesulfovibrio TaxID=2661612 RepID=UPI000FEC2098|nr:MULTISPECIES: Mrp/NBP35 family ATP-binding protein [unclassified Pseudodesulfovibrio]MCJ2163651.1 Mrp/NBP35 family ATP-binding protein [Pseudodesulfovibrio sp. S3-i]RWU06086.1 ATP-binding protein [Pseudodesulfovibrio sp. S3]
MTQCSSGSCGGSGNPSAKMQIQDALIKSTLEKIKYKLFIMSGKGGVGKSSVSVNVAAALAARGFKVGLLDVDIHGPSVPTLLGISGNMDVDRGSLMIPMEYNENLHVVSMESLLKDPDQAVLWRGPMKTSAIRQFVSDVQWGDLDFLVVDSPPGTGDEPMTVLKTVPDALAVVVTTPQEVSLSDVRKSINFLQYAQANILGVVENMSGLVCPHCHQSIDLFKKGGGKMLAEKYGLDFLGAIPLDPATVVAGDLGVPVVLLEADSSSKRAFIELADVIAEAAQKSLEAASTSQT